MQVKSMHIKSADSTLPQQAGSSNYEYLYFYLPFILATDITVEGISALFNFCLPFPEGKKQSISTLLRECEIQRALLGTSPSWGGLRSVVRTKHQPGLSLGLSSNSTVCPTWILSSLLWLAIKSCSTTVSSHPPDSCKGRKLKQKRGKVSHLQQGTGNFHITLALVMRNIVQFNSFHCGCFQYVASDGIQPHTCRAKQMGLIQLSVKRVGGLSVFFHC